MVKTLSCVLGALLLSAAASLAQVSVEVVAEPDYLPGEDLEIQVRITNLSGQTIALGKSPDWLSFSVETPAGFVLPAAGSVPVAGELELESSKTAIRRVNLAPQFELLKPGRYAVTATVKIPGWTSLIHSRPRSFDIISGVKIWEQEFGVPLTGAEQGEPEVRRYILQKATHKKQSKLYVRVSDRLDARVFAVFPLGVSVSFSRLERQLDRQNLLHVLFQSGARTFSYCVVNPDGMLVARQTHEIVNRSLPVLGLDADGNIRVTGGVRRPEASDVPPNEAVRDGSTAPNP